MTPYISMTASHDEVLRLYSDAIHPEIARRFEELVTAEDSAEQLTEKLCDVDTALGEIDSLLEDVRSHAVDVESGALEDDDEHERAELCKEWYERMESALDAMQKAINKAIKITEA